MTMPTYYELLDIPVHASKQEVRRAYLQKCKEFHPDLHGGAEWAHERLQNINEAYHTLSDAFNRQQYDADLMQQPETPTPPPSATTEALPSATSTSSAPKYIGRILAGTLAVVLWSAVIIVKNFQSTPDEAALANQAIQEEQLRFQQFCERHPKLIKKSEYFLVMNTQPPIGFTFELERLLAKGDTTALHERIKQLQPDL
ncbi:MAG: J domain-containing protein [Bacteroidota bacterium]